MSTNSCESFSPHQMRKVGPTRRSVSGHYAFRGDASIPFESTLERDFLLKCEHSLTVLDVVAQPVQVPFKGQNGQNYTYTPDYLVYSRLGNHSHVDYPKPLLVEIKPSAEWRSNWRSWLPKWKAAWRFAQEQGWLFLIQDESRIRDTALTNIRFLERYKRMNFPEAESQSVLVSIREMGCTSVDYLLARHFMGIYRKQGLAHIWHLLATRQVECDISRKLNEMTELWEPDYE